MSGSRAWVAALVLAVSLGAQLGALWQLRRARTSGRVDACLLAALAALVLGLVCVVLVR